MFQKMKMSSKYMSFSIFLTLFHISLVYADLKCGDWDKYGEAKCIKIFDTEKFVTFEMAIKSCSQIDQSSEILTIHSKEEQDFIAGYLFETRKSGKTRALADNVWIGLKKTGVGFKWVDSSNKQYTNWQTGNPIDKPDYNCVQLESDSHKWTNKPCNKKNLVVCQKLAELTLSDLTKELLEIKNDLKETKKELKISDYDTRLIRYELNDIFYIVFNNKVSHYQLFNDVNGKNKAFIIPLSSIRNKHTFEGAVNLCKEFNSTLIEIESMDKQIILESFLGRLGFESKIFSSFWVNGFQYSAKKWKWLSSGKEITFTNWFPGRGVGKSGDDNIIVYTYSTDTFGKWDDIDKLFTSRVICEFTFGF